MDNIGAERSAKTFWHAETLATTALDVPGHPMVIFADPTPEDSFLSSDHVERNRLFEYCRLSVELNATARTKMDLFSTEALPPFGCSMALRSLLESSEIMRLYEPAQDLLDPNTRLFTDALKLASDEDAIELCKNAVSPRTFLAAVNEMVYSDEVVYSDEESEPSSTVPIVYIHVMYIPSNACNREACDHKACDVRKEPLSLYVGRSEWKPNASWESFRALQHNFDAVREGQKSLVAHFIERNFIDRPANDATDFVFVMAVPDTTDGKCSDITYGIEEDVTKAQVAEDFFIAAGFTSKHYSHGLNVVCSLAAAPDHSTYVNDQWNQEKYFPKFVPPDDYLPMEEITPAIRQLLYSVMHATHRLTRRNPVVGHRELQYELVRKTFAGYLYEALNAKGKDRLPEEDLPQLSDILQRYTRLSKYKEQLRWMEPLAFEDTSPRQRHLEAYLMANGV
ncbi:hypothetical protein PYCC9005_000595 [Savitreella phatthalungensis]